MKRSDESCFWGTWGSLQGLESEQWWLKWFWNLVIMEKKG
jgi:hypothetical protein